MVEVLVNLGRLSVLWRKSSTERLWSHAYNLGGHLGLGRTLSVTLSGATASSLGRMVMVWTDTVPSIMVKGTDRYIFLYHRIQVMR